MMFRLLVNMSSWNQDISKLLFHTENKTAAFRKKPGFCVLRPLAYQAGNPGSREIIQSRFQGVSILASVAVASDSVCSQLS